MPIIINEIVFKATVEANAPQPRPAAVGAGVGAGFKPAPTDRDALVAAIVEEVLRVLDRAKER